MPSAFPEQLDGGRSALAVVVTRAALDREFRVRLLADPHRAIREVFGLDLPAGFRIRFIEKGPDLDLLVVLPDLVEDLGQLDQNQLDVVLGGSDDAPRRLLVRFGIHGVRG